MKFLLVILLILVGATLKAQNLEYIPNIQIDTVAHKIKFTETVELPGVSGDRIFYRAIAWFSREFDVHQAYITMANRNTGQVIGHAARYAKYHVIGVYTYIFYYNIYITVKDGKFRFTITDFTEQYGTDDAGLPKLFSSDIYINDPKYKTGKGNYTGMAKQHLEPLEGYSRYIMNSLRFALTSSELDNTIKNDDF